MADNDNNILAKPEIKGPSSQNPTVPSTTWKEYIPGIPKMDESPKNKDGSLAPTVADTGSTLKTPDAISDQYNGQGPVFLQGTVEKHGHPKGRSEEPHTDTSESTLKGSVKKQTLDPDAADRDLLIAWDAWRNTVIKEELKSLRGLLHGWDGMVYNRAYNRTDPRFPVGLTVATIAEVNANRQITQIDLVKSSGDPEFDKVVIKAINKLNGKKFLEYPTGSRRSLVGQPSFLKTSETAQKTPTFIFNDYEHVSDKQ
jgi:hypothetical protein